jgi:hypothetical protein
MIKSIKEILKSNLFFTKYFLNSYVYIIKFIRSRNLQKNGLKVLAEANNLLDENNIFCWPDHGTLLGLIRDGGLIEGDLDLDLGIFINDYNKKIEQLFKVNGFRLISEILIDGGEYGREQTFKKSGVTIDLFYHTKKDNFTFCHLFSHHPEISPLICTKKYGGLRVIENYFPYHGLEKKMILGVEFNVPKKVHEYLKFHYGSDYLVPKRWNYSDTLNDNKNAKYLDDKIGKVTTY